MTITLNMSRSMNALPPSEGPRDSLHNLNDACYGTAYAYGNAMGDLVKTNLKNQCSDLMWNQQLLTNQQYAPRPPIERVDSPRHYFVELITGSMKKKDIWTKG